MYKCMMCGKPLPTEKGKTFLGSDWREVKCVCGSRIFVKVRRQHIRRVKAK